MSDRATPRRRLRRAGALAALGSGAGFGLLHALPVENVRAAGKCPPPGEGLYYCVLQKAWMPAVVEVLLLATAAYLLYEFCMSLPSTWRAFRAERAQRREAARPPWERDRTLLASTWGNTYDDPSNPRPQRESDGPVVVAVPRRQSAAPAPAPMSPSPAAASAERDPARTQRLARIALALDLAAQLGLEPKPEARDRRAA